MKKGKIRLMGYDNCQNVVEQGVYHNGYILFFEQGNNNIYHFNGNSAIIHEFLEKYKLTLAQMKVSYEYVDYKIEVTDNVITSINVEESQLKNFVKNEDIKLFKIPVSAEYSGFIEVLGTSLDNACDRASEDEGYIPMPHDKEYIDGSFQIGLFEDAQYYNDENGKIEETIK